MMPLFLDVKMVDEYGRVHGAVRLELPEKAAYMGNRIADDMRAGVFGSMEQSIEVLKVRELRRGLLSDAAMQAGYQLADFLQDREGWHGIDRQEARERAVTLARS
jgi:hypothetical protein